MNFFSRPSLIPRIFSLYLHREDCGGPTLVNPGYNYIYYMNERNDRIIRLAETEAVTLESGGTAVVATAAQAYRYMKLGWDFGAYRAEGLPGGAMAVEKLGPDCPDRAEMVNLIGGRMNIVADSVTLLGGENGYREMFGKILAPEEWEPVEEGRGTMTLALNCMPRMTGGSLVSDGDGMSEKDHGGLFLAGMYVCASHMGILEKEGCDEVLVLDEAAKRHSMSVAFAMSAIGMKPGEGKPGKVVFDGKVMESVRMFTDTLADGEVVPVPMCPNTAALTWMVAGMNVASMCAPGSSPGQSTLYLGRGAANMVTVLLRMSGYLCTQYREPGGGFQIDYRMKSDTDYVCMMDEDAYGIEPAEFCYARGDGKHQDYMFMLSPLSATMQVNGCWI